MVIPMNLTFTENASVFCGSFGVSAPTYGRAEDVRIVPIVVSELKFRDVQRQILAADLVEAAHDAAFQQRPEAINRLRVDDAINILSRRVIDGLVIKNLVQRIVGRVFIRRDQADLIGHSTADESIQGRAVGTRDYPRNDIALPLRSADDDFLASAPGPFRPLIRMTVLILSADIGFSRVASSLSFFRGLSLTLANSEQAYRPRGIRNIGSLSTIS
jgi:hypothetical protein